MLKPLLRPFAQLTQDVFDSPALEDMDSCGYRYFPQHQAENQQTRMLNRAKDYNRDELR
jgi:hypothetical protein